MPERGHAAFLQLLGGEFRKHREGDVIFLEGRGVLTKPETFKPGGGYVFNNVHNIQAGVPAENIVAMYDKNDWSLRLAYNWRSKYLLTTRDVISKYPLWNDDSGFLDGSAFYNVNENVTVGLQLTNIANTQTKTITSRWFEDSQEAGEVNTTISLR